MVERGEGKIIFVASLLSFQGGITVPGYAASKGGVAQLTKALANEWAPHGVNVNAIAPGYIATDNTRQLREDETRSRQILERIPAGRWGTPADVAGAFVFLASRGGRLRSRRGPPRRRRLACPMMEHPPAERLVTRARLESDKALARRRATRQPLPADTTTVRPVRPSTLPGPRVSATSTPRPTTASGSRSGVSGPRSPVKRASDVRPLHESRPAARAAASRGLMDDGGFAVPAEFRRVWDFSRDGVLRSLAESLERLAVDRVDIVYLHDPDDHRDDAFLRAYPALEELRSQGLVKAIGAGMNQSAMLADFARRHGRRRADARGPLHASRPVGARRSPAASAPIGMSPSSLPACSTAVCSHSRCRPPTARYEYREAPGELVDRATRIASACERHGTTLPAAALAFPLAHPAVVSVCIGAHLPEQVVRNAALGRAAVPGALWVELKEEGLLRRDAPVPAV